LTVEEYFGMIINISMGLTLVALMLIFLYMIYGEKEKELSSSTNKAAKTFQKLLIGLHRFHVSP